MKKIIVYLIILIVSLNISFSQSVAEYNKQIDSLNLVLKKVNSEIIDLNKRKTNLENLIKAYSLKKDKLDFDNKISEGIPTKLLLNGTIRDEPNIMGKEIVKVLPGEIVLVYDWYKRPFFRVKYKGMPGYLSHVSLELNENLKGIVKKDEPPENELTVEERIIDRRIKRKEIWIGMTAQMAQSSLGKPDDVNKTIGSWGVHEQWVYSQKNLYLYFENGILKTIQQ